MVDLSVICWYGCHVGMPLSKAHFLAWFVTKGSRIMFSHREVTEKLLKSIHTNITVIQTQLPRFVRPWQSTVPPLESSVEKIVRYAADDESHGILNVAWRGPPAKVKCNLDWLHVPHLYYLYHIRFCTFMFQFKGDNLSFCALFVLN